MNDLGPVAWITIAYVAISFVLVVITALVAYRILKRFGRMIFGDGAVFGTDRRTRVIAFGIAAVLFPSVIPWVVYTISTVFLGVFNDLPRWVSNDWQRSVFSCQGAAPIAQCVAQTGFALLHAFGAGLSDVYRALGVNDFPFRDAVWLLTVWAILAQLLATEGAHADKPSGFWLQGAYGRLSDTGRQNLRFFVVLALAAYLSIAAIAAIPGLQEQVSASTEVSVEQLRKEVADEPRAIDVTPLQSSNPFQPLEAALGRPGSSAPLSDAPSSAARLSSDNGGVNSIPDDKIAAVSDSAVVAGQERSNQALSSDLRATLEQLLAVQRQRRQELVRLLETLGSYSRDEAMKARGRALTTYQTSNVERKGSRERAQHLNDIAEWYREGISTLNAAIAECEIALSRVDGSLKTWSNQMAREISGDSVLVAVPSFPAADEILLEEPFRDSRRACQQVRIAGRVPPRPALGSYLGPFGLVASWLVRTESLPLALIVGLLGFGLLGAACSTFVREQKSRTVDGPLIKDLPSVIIRGLSAAIVVFLAVEGGLAIFSSGQPEPNPYVLLLTCLIAAVFSEHVWAWALRHLRENFRLDDPSNSSGRRPESQRDADQDATYDPPT